MDAQLNVPDLSKLNWENLHTALMVAQRGSLSAAAEFLGVNHSTVARRIATLEVECGHALFRRLARGSVPTAAGEVLVAAIQRMADALDQAHAELGQSAVGLSGTIRLTTPDDLANHFLLEPLAQFRRLHPGIVFEVALDRRMYNLSRREADVAIRARQQPPDGMAARRIVELGGAVYASRTAFPELEMDEGERPLTKLQKVSWVGWEEDSATNNLKRWLDQHCPRKKIVYRANSLAHQAEAVRAGIGIGVLPCFIGDVMREVVRVMPPQDDMATDLWLLTHPDLEQVPRIAALIDFLQGFCEERAALLAGWC